MKKYKIAVAGTGYVGLSIAILLAQHNCVKAVDIIKEKDLHNHFYKSESMNLIYCVYFS